MRADHLTRRDIFALLGGCVFALGACAPSADSVEPDPADDDDDGTPTDGTTDSPDAPTMSTSDAPRPDGCVAEEVLVHDTNAQALYFDGTYGPLTGVITVAMMAAGETVTLDFWHGHNGMTHRFTLEPSHFAALLRGERVTVGTSTVDDHSHMLFIDPRDEAYRVPGAPDVSVALPC